MACPVCGGDVPAKDPSKPGPQAKYCGRDCQVTADHRLHRARARDATRYRRELAAALERIEVLEVELRLAHAALAGKADLSRVRAGDLDDAVIRAYRSGGGA